MPIISTLQPNDFDALMVIEHLCHHYPWSDAVMRSNSGDHYLNLKICDHTHLLLGYAITQVIADEATLFNLAIHPSAQRKGIASQLLEALFEQLSTRGITTLWLEVRVSNAKAIQLYHKLGFNEVTLRKGYYPTENAQREDALIMAYYL